MQIIYFEPVGEFVIHKIPYNGGKLSAWFDQYGNLLDIEKFDKTGRHTGRGIEAAKEFVARYGSIYKRI